MAASGERAASGSSCALKRARRERAATRMATTSPPNTATATAAATASEAEAGAGATDGGVTYAHQPSLARLPLPDLTATLDKFVRTVAPLLAEGELERTKALARDYGATVGPAHCARLAEYARSRASYIEEFWDDAYLRYDAPAVINVNPVFVLEDDPTPSRSQAIPRAVSLVFSSLKFVRAVRLAQLAPDRVKDAPLCMSQYKRLFASARVPDPRGAEADVVVTSETSTHIVVICRSQLYYFDCARAPARARRREIAARN